jgi:transposase
MLLWCSQLPVPFDLDQLHNSGCECLCCNVSSGSQAVRVDNGGLSRPGDDHHGVDPFHLVQLGNLMVTRVRQRLIREREQRRGRKVDPAWATRRLLLRGYDTLSPRAKARLDAVFASDDPTDELSAAWGVKEQLRRLLNVATVEQARTEKMILGCYVVAADMEETWRLWATIQAWWPAIEVLIEHRVTNARTEAANTGIKQIKRTGRGYRNPAHYQARILLTSAARRAA